MKCKNCGAELNENNKFCSKCGVVIEDKTTNHNQENVVNQKSINNKKIIIAVIAIIVFIVAVTSVVCINKAKKNNAGGTQAESIVSDELSNNSTNKLTKETEKVTEAIDYDAILKSYYDSNYQNGHSGYSLFDFDKDGKKEMIITNLFFVGQSDSIERCDIILVKLKDGSAFIADTFTISDSAFSKYEAFLNANSQLPQYVEVYINSKGNIACNVFTKLDAWLVHYLILEVNDDRITVGKHLLDPGGTIFNALYVYETYNNDPLFIFEVPDYYSGKYNSYKTAVDEELGVYGFEYQKADFDSSNYDNEIWKKINEKYYIKGSDSVNKVYSYRNSYNGAY